MVRRLFCLLQADVDWLVREAKKRKVSAAAVVRELIRKARETP